MLLVSATVASGTDLQGFLPALPHRPPAAAPRAGAMRASRSNPAKAAATPAAAKAAGAPAAAKAPGKRAAQPSAPGGGSAVGSGSNTDANPTQMLARARACFGLDWPAPRHAMQAGVTFLEEALWGRPPPPTSPSALLDSSSNAGGARISVNGADASGKTGGSSAEGASNGSSSSGGGTDSGSSSALLLQQHRRRRVVLVPDKDVDGLSAGALLLRTLNALIREARQQCRPGADDVEVAVVHIGKGENVFQPHVAARLVTAAPTALVLLDMGSRGGGGPLLPQLPLAAAAAPAPEQRRKDGEGMEERQLPIDDSVGGGAVAKAVAPAAASAAAECAGGKGGGEGGGGDDGGGGGGFAVPTLVIDHHKPEGFPEGAVAVSAFGCAPVATSALLTWCLCAELHPASAAASSWLAVLGTLGDLGEEGLGVFTGAVGGGDDGGAAAAAIASGAGAGQGGGQSSASAGRGGGASDGGSSSGGGSASDGVEQQAGGAAASGTTAAAGAALPELDWVFRAGRKTHFKDAVALLNAARRSPECDVAGAWAALCAAQQPADISKGGGPGAAALRAARANLKAEVDRLAATPPRFSSDGGVALLAVSSGWQVHPLLPQRWAYRLGSQDRRGRLRAVMCANRGYMPGRVHFSMRRATGPGGAGVDLICLLQDLVAQRCALAGVADTPLSGLGGRLGADFARGHPEATGGMLAAEDFAQLMLLMGFSADLAYGAAGMTVGPEHKQLAEAAAAALQSLQPAQGEARTQSSGGAVGTPGARSGAKKRGGGGGSASTVAGATDSKQRKLTDFMPARPKKAATPEQP